MAWYAVIAANKRVRLPTLGGKGQGSLPNNCFPAALVRHGGRRGLARGRLRAKILLMSKKFTASTLSIWEIAATAVKAAVCGVPKLKPLPQGQSVIDIGDYRADSSKIRAGLCGQAQFPFARGIRMAMDRYGIAHQQIAEWAAAR